MARQLITQGFGFGGTAHVVTDGLGFPQGAVLNHTIRTLTLTLGEHTKLVGVGLGHVVAGLTITLGTHVSTVGITFIHTASSLQVTRGTHGISITPIHTCTVITLTITLGNHVLRKRRAINLPMGSGEGIRN